MLKKKSKKGSKLISLYWFLILTIVAGGIVMMVNAFYSSPYDVRELEANILAQKVASCMIHGGEMSPELMSTTSVFKESFKDHFPEICSLNFDPGKEFERPEYYVEVKIYRGLSSSDDTVFDLKYGNSNWKSDCNFKNPNLEKVSKCVTNEFYAFGRGNPYKIKILTIVGKTNQNVQ